MMPRNLLSAALLLFAVGCINEGDADNGALLYDEHCATCHGVDGEGVDSLGPALDGNLGDLSDTAILSIIDGGVAGTAMPAFRTVLTPEEQEDILAFLRDEF